MKEEGRSAGCFKGRAKFHHTRIMLSYAMRYLVFYCTRPIHPSVISHGIGGPMRVNSRRVRVFYCTRPMYTLCYRLAILMLYDSFSPFSCGTARLRRPQHFRKGNLTDQATTPLKTEGLPEAEGENFATDGAHRRRQNCFTNKHRRGFLSNLAS